MKAICGRKVVVCDLRPQRPHFMHYGKNISGNERISNATFRTSMRFFGICYGSVVLFKVCSPKSESVE